MPGENLEPTCAHCGIWSCRTRNEAKYPAFCLTKNTDPDLLREALDAYAAPGDSLRVAREAAILEADAYGRLTRVEETIEFIRRMGYRSIGIASCVGMMPETSIFSSILSGEGMESYTVGCKIGAVDKSVIGIPEGKKLNGGCGHESMCNPIMQAKKLAERKTDFNIVIGLCVGHDTLFLQHSKAPVTVMIVKDRALGHNPVAALYTARGMYSRFRKKKPDAADSLSRIK
ncbi:MAG: DUF1847 domain-containing protein [Desulfovibrio sp.]|jgi:uncharacterized metal-binding protein|nr:DUF1847 domain-containing protein [Desulfovibrio sp.]